MPLSDRKLVLILFVLVVALGGAWALLSAINAEQVAELKKTNSQLKASVEARDKENAALKEKVAKQASEMEPQWERFRSEVRGTSGAAGPAADSGGANLTTQDGEAVVDAVNAGVVELRAAVEKSLKDKDPEALIRNLTAMLALGEPAYPAFMEIEERLRGDPALMQMLSSRRRDFMALLQSKGLHDFYVWALSSEKVSDDFRVLTVLILGRAGGSETIPPLVSLLKRTNNDDLIEATLRTLGSFRATEALPVLSDMLRGGEIPPERRLAILQALGRIGTDSSAAILLPYAGPGNSDTATRMAAVVALTRAGSEAAVPYVVEGLTGTDQQIRRQILRALAESGTVAQNGQVSNQLIDLATASTDPETRRDAFNAMRSLPPDIVVDAVVRGIQGQPDQVRQGGLETLARINTPSSTAAITQIAQNDPSDNLKRFASRILQRRQGGDGDGGGSDFRRMRGFRR